jgi:hypothetical protein
MNELETQIAKIQFGNPKQTTTHVFVMAEQAFNGRSELYLITELPMFNPAAFDECDRIANALAASLRRTYRKITTPDTFEHALAGLNDELGKLTTQGKTHWIGKLNAIVAIKDGTRFSIASTGKVTALLYRDDEFNSVIEPSAPSNVLKTFENFSVGKLHLGDIVILSTNQLFSNISADRIKNILNDHTLPLAGQEILRILQENTGPETAFGSLLALMVEPGTTQVEHVSLEDYVPPAKMHKQMAIQAVQTGKLAIQRAFDSTKALTLRTVDKVRKPEAGDMKTVLLKNRDILSAVGTQAKSNLTLENFGKLSRQKKFFFISAIVLLVALTANVIIAQRYRSRQGDEQTIQTVLGNVQKLVNDSNAALLYGDENQSRTLLAQAKTELGALPEISEKDQQSVDDTRKQVQELEDKLEKKVTIEAQSVATLSVADRLINLPRYIGTKTGESIVSFDKSTNKVEDNILISSQTIKASHFVKGNQAVIYNGERLFLWNFVNSTTGSGFNTQVPEEKDWAGLFFYTGNNRVYLIDKAKGQVVNFVVSDRDISKPSVSITSSDLNNAIDLAVDSNIYVLTPTTVKKFQAGKPLSFNFPALATPLSGSGRIYTDPDMRNVYVLDPGNKRVIIVDKNGNLQQIIYSPQFTNPKDFVVDEKNKMILVLNDTTLLKLNY